ncbi:MAG: hypothetical protein ABW360_04225 [Phenylobacterium sp.]
MGANFTTPSRDDRIYEEAAALWRQVFGEAPPRADGAAMLDIIMRSLPEQTYDRLRTPHMRPSNIAWPTAPMDRSQA